MFKKKKKKQNMGITSLWCVAPPTVQRNLVNYIIIVLYSITFKLLVLANYGDKCNALWHPRLPYRLKIW